MQYAKTEPIKFLKDNNIDKIILNKDIYAKIGADKTAAKINSAPQAQKNEPAPGKSNAKEVEENLKIKFRLKKD